MSYRFWNLSDSGYREYPDGTQEQRWQIDKQLILHHLHHSLFRHVGPVTEWNQDMRLECYSKGPVQDMPWAGWSARPVISDRLRHLLEHLAPGHVQFLPVQLTLRRKTLKLPPYWVANWLREIDCYDRDRTTMLPVRDDEGQPQIGELVVDRRRIPRDAMVFIVKYERILCLIREDLKAAFEEAKVTGCQFYEVDQGP